MILPGTFRLRLAGGLDEGRVQGFIRAVSAVQ